METGTSKLPKPNVVVALSDEKAHEMTPAHVRGMICNPIYAGIPVYHSHIAPDPVDPKPLLDQIEAYVKRPRKR